MISACQTSPTAIRLIATTQIVITKPFCVSEAGTSKQRAIQAMVAGLLVLGRYAVGTTRDFADEPQGAREHIWATQGPVQIRLARRYRLRESTACNLTSATRQFRSPFTLCKISAST